MFPTLSPLLPTYFLLLGKSPSMNCDMFAPFCKANAGYLNYTETNYTENYNKFITSTLGHSTSQLHRTHILNL